MAIQRIALFILLILSHVLVYSRGGLEHIIVEKYYVSDINDSIQSSGSLPVGSITYRIYADMLPGYKLQAVYGIPGHELRIATTTSFFNNEDAGATSGNAIPKKHVQDNTVMLDSWLSVGAASSGHIGVLKTKDNGVETIINANGILKNKDKAAGIPISVEDGLILGKNKDVTFYGISSEELEIFGSKNTNVHGTVFSTTNGSWACLGGAVGVDSSNIVLIAQLTTNGKLSFELNLQIGTPKEGVVENYVAKRPLENEMQLTDGSLRYTTKGPNASPEVTIMSPKTGDVVEAGIALTIDVSATDKDGQIDLVELYVNDIKIGEAKKKPFRFKYTAAGGRLKLNAIAIDDLGSETTSTPNIVSVEPRK